MKFSDGFGIDCSEVIRASSDDDIYVAVDGLLQDYGAYAQQDEEYAKGGKTKKKMWLAKERGGEEFVLEAPNKKEAEEDASMYGGYIVREIKNFKENPDGSVEYAKGGEVDVYGSVDEKDWDKYKDNIMGYSIDETNYHDNPLYYLYIYPNPFHLPSHTHLPRRLLHILLTHQGFP